MILPTPTTSLDNAWFIGHHPALKFEDGQTYDTYVISIAGTASIYSLLHDDMAVGEVVDFPAWVKAGLQTPPEPQTGDNHGTYIAYGTASGVNTLVTQPIPASSAVGSGTLLRYLSTLAATPRSRIVFTGISLGGALSPTLALGLLNSGTLKAFDPKNVLVYPIAGPSPGDPNFAQLFQTTFPQSNGSDYQWWNTNIVNPYDIVPKFWCDDKTVSPDQNIFNIPGLYDPPLAFRLGLNGLVVVIKTWYLEKSKIVYKPITSFAFEQDQPARVRNWDDFKKTAFLEHLEMYRKHIGVPPFSGLDFSIIPRDKKDEIEADSTEVAA